MPNTIGRQPRIAPRREGAAIGFDLSDLAEMRVTDNEFADVSVKEGDLVVCEGGEPGRCAVWQDSRMSTAIQKALHRVRPWGSISPWYLAFHLGADANSGRLAAAFTGSTIRHFTGQSLKRHAVALPPLAEQDSIVSEVQRLLSLGEFADQQTEGALLRSERLRQSILKRAFEGKLVPQDPNDEPASKLLERIKAEREAAEAKPKKTKRRKTKSSSR